MQQQQAFTRPFDTHHRAVAACLSPLFRADCSPRSAGQLAFSAQAHGELLLGKACCAGLLLCMCTCDSGAGAHKVQRGGDSRSVAAVKHLRRSRGTNLSIRVPGVALSSGTSSTVVKMQLLVFSPEAGRQQCLHSPIVHFRLALCCAVRRSAVTFAGLTWLQTHVCMCPWRLVGRTCSGLVAPGHL